MINEKELNKSLREKAISNGLCAQWQRDWKKDWDVEEMISKFFKGLDFFLKNRFMSNEFMKDNFDIDVRRSHNVLVDDDYQLSNPKQSLITGNSNARINVDSWNVATIYIIDNSFTKVIAKENAFVMVHVLDSAQVNVTQEGDSKVFVYVHSKDSVVITTGKVTVKENLDYLKK